MAATKMFLIKWYSSSTNLKTSGTTYLLVVWKSSGLLGSLLTKSSGLPGSRLDFLEVFQIWKTSGTTYLLVVWKSSGLLGSLLTKSSGLPGSRLDFLKVVWTSCKVVWKSSELLKSYGLPRSLLTKFSSISSGIQACLCRGMIYNSFTTKLYVAWSTQRLFLQLTLKSVIVWLKKNSKKLDGLHFSRHRLVLHLTELFQKFDFSGRLTFQSSNDLQLSRHRLVLQLKKKPSRFNYIQTTYNSVVQDLRGLTRISEKNPRRLTSKSSGGRLNYKSSVLQISKSIAKITSALTRRLPGKSSTARRLPGKLSTARRLPGKSSTARRLPNSLAYIRLLQAHRITNESHPPRVVSFYDSMNHKNFRIKILGFFSSLWRESERYVVFSSQEWKKEEG
ncbi:hypothetical protein IGI04_027135 [Brassica rapa subsp. trilocularis]|uniref:Uncharacterized protein n=1 Tax=Brassica rapa subsp. trilocularis TaxID=1813537 RepID=A0ABQ7KYA8_BRACM|nr:hypothetical protein IGI04_027135 [Brassica rapa subsp. trilocularis]